MLKSRLAISCVLGFLLAGVAGFQPPLQLGNGLNDRQARFRAAAEISRISRSGRHQGSSSDLRMMMEGRRRALQTLGTTGLGVLLPSVSNAVGLQEAVAIYGSDGDKAAGLTENVASMLGKRLDPKFISQRRPTPVKVPRTQLYRPFAVLLMRSCYDVVDGLDFVPMDKFQKDFFLLRQNEWEKYLEETDSRQGDLSDPQYFDFISAAQFATITQEMRSGQLVFEEQTGAEGQKAIVRRDQAFSDNDLLPVTFYERAGDKMYNALLTNFSGPDHYTQPPQPTKGGDVTSLIKNFEVLYRVIVENGYALDFEVADAGSVPESDYAKAMQKFNKWNADAKTLSEFPQPTGQGRKLVVKMQAPCNLWGRQWLGMQGYLHTDHDVMIAMSYLRQSGQAATVSTKVEQNSIVREYVLL